ncbi:hypothetical protein JOC76_001270 [Neobacillus cucumis]|nr:hypothetical protein [Neobacillus cucumis]
MKVIPPHCLLVTSPGPCSLEEAIRNSSQWLTERTIALMNVISCYLSHKVKV